MSETPLTKCPEDRIWDELATGILPAAEADSALLHASNCAECSPKLRESLRIFASDTPIPIAAKQPKFPNRAWLAVAAALIATISLSLWLYLKRPDPLQDLANAYTTQRTLEARLDGARHSRLIANRAASPGLTQKPSQLLSTASSIRAALDAKPNDPLWLHAQGRLALIDGKPEEAITALRASRSLQSSPPISIRIDLATAYLLRAGQLGAAGAADLTLAYELLSAVLTESPDQPAALFNRSLVAVELGLYPVAIADLEHLLRIEKDSGWRNEAQSRLDELRKRFQGFWQRDPDADANTFAEVALDNHLRNRLVPPAPSLAARLESNHNDPWLTEVSNLAAKPDLKEPIQQLARLAEIRLTARRGLYSQERNRTQSIVNAKLPDPLAAWRDFEIAYRSTHSGGEFPCDPPLPNPRYSWLHAQTEREAAACAIQRGNLPAALNLFRAASNLALKANLPVSHVRAEAALAGLEYRQGRWHESFLHEKQLIHQIINNRLPPSRLHEPLLILSASAEALGRLHTALAAANLAAEAARHTGLANAEFADLSTAARLAQSLGRRQQSAKLFSQALELFNSTNGEVASPSAHLALELGMAEATGSTERLKPLMQALASSTDPLVRVPYQRTLARQHLNNGDRTSALKTLEQAFQLQASSTPAATPWVWRAELNRIADDYLNLLLDTNQAHTAWHAFQRILDRNEAILRTFPSQPLLLPAHTLFSFRQSGPTLVVWRVRNNQIEFRRASTPAQALAEDLLNLRTLVANPNNQPALIEAQSAAFSRSIFGSWLEELQANEEILFQGEGIWTSIPFSILMAHNKPLALQHPVALTFGPIGKKQSPVERTNSGPRLFVDATRVTSLSSFSLMPLPRPDAEFTAIANSAYTYRTLTGPAATANSLNESLSRSSLLHFAGHALAEPGRIGLILEDGLYSLVSTQSPSLVILSACSTASSTDDEYDATAPSSLARRFILAGASEVVASSWNLDNQAASILMKSLYSGLDQNRPPGESLFVAIRNLRQQPGFSHPAYWASALRIIHPN